MAIPTLSSPSARSNAVPVPCARAVPSHASRAAVSGCHPKTRTRHSRRPGPGIPVTRVSSTRSAARGSKGHCPKGCGPLACGAHATVAWRKHIYSTWPPPPRAISIGLSLGWRSAHEPRRGLHALPPWHLCMPCPRSPLPSEQLTHSSLELFSIQTVFCYFILQKSFL